MSMSMRLHVTIAFTCALILSSVGSALATSTKSPNQDLAPPQLQQEDWAPPNAVYVPETGHIVQGAFLDYWRDWNAAASFGWPITPEIEEDGRTVQYFGFARLELTPEGVVEHGDIGSDYKPYVVEAMEIWANDEDADAVEPAITEVEAIDVDEVVASEARGFLRAMEPRDPDAVEDDTPDRRFIEETGHVVQFAFKTFWENTGEDAYLGNPMTDEYTLGNVTYQIFERGQLHWEPQSQARMDPVGLKLAELRGLDTEPVPQGEVPTYDESLFVPPPTPTPPPPEAEPDPEPVAPAPDGERWIQVDLTNQYMIAWQGDVPVIETFVSTGRDQFATPPGTYYVLRKIPIQDMEGVIGGEYYNVPDVPHVIYFTNVGHAFHGTYWHDNFGTPMSHGCINLPMGIAEQLYEWTPMGARVEIHY